MNLGNDVVDRLVVLNDFVAGGGGAAELAVSSAAWISARGVPVTFIGGESQSDPRLVAAGVDFLTCGQAGLLASPVKGAVNGLYNTHAAEVVRRWIAENDTPGTVYHLHNWSQIFSPAVFRALAPVSDRLVMTAHDFFLACPNGAYADYPRGAVCQLTPLSSACVKLNCDRRSYAHKLWRVARQVLVRFLREGAAAKARITVLHDAMIPFLMRGGLRAEQMVVLRNPVRPFATSPIAAEKNRTFVFIGRLHEGKGPDLFLAAAQKAGVEAMLIGDGPQREALAAQYPQARITGWKTPEQIAELVRDARAVVMPSRYPEPFGLTALEATWSGLPVVVADTAMLAPEIVAAEAGLAVNVYDPDAFAAALARLAQDDDLVRRFGENAFQRTRALACTPTEWIDRLLDLYRSVSPARERAPAI